MKKPDEIVAWGPVAIDGAELVPAEPVRLPDVVPETFDEAEQRGPSAKWKFWNDQIQAALTHEKLFRAEAEACERAFFGPQQDMVGAGPDGKELPKISDRVALIHANVEVLKPLIFSETPQPIVRRRYNGDGGTDETDLMAVEAVQRLATYLLDTEDFDGAMEGARDDWLIAGRGVGSVVYKATFKTQPADPMMPEAVPAEVKTEERVATRHREWRRVLFCPGHAWEDTPWLSMEMSMTRGQIERRFPDHLKYFAFNKKGLIGTNRAAEDDDTLRSPTTVIGNSGETDATVINPFDTTTVHEIWNRETKEVIWWSPDCTADVLDEIADPLALDGFYPMPRPLLASTKGRRMTPRPDIRYYEHRAEEIDIASKKMSEILNIISVSGLIPGNASEEFKKLFSGKSQIIPVAEWLTLMQKGGVNDMVQWLPLAPMIAALQALGQMREQSRQAMFEASGVSDIMRAQGDPNETATAQQIKGRYAGLRLSSRQRRMAIFALDMLRLMIDVAVGQFDTAYLARICGLDIPLTEADREAEIARREGLMQSFQKQAELHQTVTATGQQEQQAGLAPSINPGPPPEPPKFKKPVSETSWELVHARIKDDLTRKITVSIETSSTILSDEASDKDARVEFIQAFASFVQTLLPLTATGQVPMTTMKELLLFGVRGFAKSRTLETLISQLPDEPQQGPPPEDPSVIVAKIRAEVDVELEKMKEAFDLKMKGVDLLTKAADHHAEGPGNGPDVPEALNPQPKGTKTK